MSRLRQRMVAHMRCRHFSPRTYGNYAAAPALWTAVRNWYETGSLKEA